MNYYFSDPHFWHKNMSKHRGFNSVETMNQTIIDNINSRLTKRDDLYCLGDFVWVNNIVTIKTIINQLNFRKLIFIKGNHDKPLIKFMNQSKNSRLELHNDLIIKDGDYRLHMYHYPIQDWDRKYHNKPGDYKYLHLHGHQHANQAHQNIMREKGSINVNVDLNNYKPLNIQDIIKIVNNQ